MAFVIQKADREGFDIALEHLEDEGVESRQGKTDDDGENGNQHAKNDQPGDVSHILERCENIQTRIEHQDAGDHERQGWHHGGDKEIAAQLFEVVRNGVHEYAGFVRWIALGQGFSDGGVGSSRLGCRVNQRLFPRFDGWIFGNRIPFLLLFPLHVSSARMPAGRLFRSSR